jgi:arylsulfatase A-like enzyme
MSVVLVTIDTLRADHVGCYGYGRVETSTIDRLAAEGILFENAISQVPLTNPSHATILTSAYPQSHGVLDNMTLLPGDVPTLPEVLSAEGFTTGAVVSGYPLKARTSGLNRGFMSYFDEFPADTLLGKASKVGRRRAGPATDLALTWLRSHADTPTFLWVHYFDPHDPYDPPEPFDTRFTMGLTEPISPSSELDYKRALYDGAISYVDRELGRLLRGLEELKSEDETLVVLTADHGESFEHGYLFDHAAQLYEPLVRVPLILWGPGLPAGVRVTAQVSLTDVTPTLLDLLGLEWFEGMGGRSLLPLISKAAGTAADAFALTPLRGYPHLIEPLAMIRRGDRKLILGLRTGSLELYSLTHDPGELSNLAPHRAAETEALEQRLRAWIREHTPRSGQPARLSQRDREILQSLGYLQ